MLPISTPFQIEKTDTEVKLIGYGIKQRERLFKEFLSTSKNGKIYQLKFVEVTASEVQRNYMFLCLSLAADHAGYSSEGLRAVFENMVFESAKDIEQDFFKSEDWLIDIVDLQGEVKGQTLVHMSKWTTQMMSDFIDLIQAAFTRMHPDFIFPDPKDYKLPKVGRKNEIVNKEDFSIFKF